MPCKHPEGKATGQLSHLHRTSVTRSAPSDTGLTGTIVQMISKPDIRPRVCQSWPINLFLQDGQPTANPRQLVGNLDEVTDVRLLSCTPRGVPQGAQDPTSPPEGSLEGFSHVAVATNSPNVRIFRLGAMDCSCSLDGVHTHTVLALDVASYPAPGTPNRLHS